MSKVSWPQVILFLGVFLIATTGSCFLLVRDKDVSTLLTLVAIIAVPVLTAAGAAVYQKVDQVKEMSNGNMSKMMEMVKANNDQIARLALLLPSSTDPDVLKPTSSGPTTEPAIPEPVSPNTYQSTNWAK